MSKGGWKIYGGSAQLREMDSGGLTSRCCERSRASLRRIGGQKSWDGRHVTALRCRRRPHTFYRYTVAFFLSLPPYFSSASMPRSSPISRSIINSFLNLTQGTCCTGINWQKCQHISGSCLGSSCGAILVASAPPVTCMSTGLSYWWDFP